MPSVEKITALLFAAIVGGLLIAWVNPGSPQLTDLSIKRMQFAALSKPDITTLDASSFVPAREPFRHQGRFGVARISFDVTDPVSADLALFIRRVRDNYSVYVNGKLAAPTPGTLASKRRVSTVPPGSSFKASNRTSTDWLAAW